MMDTLKYGPIKYKIWCCKGCFTIISCVLCVILLVDTFNLSQIETCCMDDAWYDAGEGKYWSDMEYLDNGQCYYDWSYMSSQCISYCTHEVQQNVLEDEGGVQVVFRMSLMLFACPFMSIWHESTLNRCSLHCTPRSALYIYI
eukprot:605207_1